MAEGDNSFAHGWKTRASGNNSTAFGYATVAACPQTFADGYYSSAGLTVAGFNITAVDVANSTVTLNSLSGYNGSNAYDLSAFIGQNVSLYGFDDGYTHLETFSNIKLTALADAKTKKFTLSKVPEFAATSTNKVLKLSNAPNYGSTLQFGSCQFAIGNMTKARGTASIATGLSSTADGTASYAGGYSANANGKYSMVWNGDASTAKYGTDLTADGLFAVNPVGGANGFYIGNQTLSAIISAAVKAGIEEYKSSLTAG